MSDDGGVGGSENESPMTGGLRDKVRIFWGADVPSRNTSRAVMLIRGDRCRGSYVHLVLSPPVMHVVQGCLPSHFWRSEVSLRPPELTLKAWPLTLFLRLTAGERKVSASVSHAPLRKITRDDSPAGNARLAHAQGGPNTSLLHRAVATVFDPHLHASDTAGSAWNTFLQETKRAVVEGSQSGKG